VGKLLPEHRLQ